APVEVVEVEFFGGLGRPQPEGVHGPAAVAHNREIIRDADDAFGVQPVPFRTLWPGSCLDPAFELDLERELGMRDLPWVAVLEPFLGLLHLVAVLDVLLEDPEIVAQPIADRGKVQGGNGIQKTRGEPAEAAIAEARIDLVFPQILPTSPSCDMAVRQMSSI